MAAGSLSYLIAATTSRLPPPFNPTDPDKQDTDQPHQPRRELHTTQLSIFTQLIVYYSLAIDRVTWNADAIVQPLCLKLRWDLPLDPRRRGALAQSEQAQAILGKRPSSSIDSTSEEL